MSTPILFARTRSQAEDEDVAGLQFDVSTVEKGTVTVKGTNHSAIRISDGKRYAIGQGVTFTSCAKVTLEQPLDTVAGDRKTGYIGQIGVIGSAGYMLAMDVTYAKAADPTELGGKQKQWDADAAALIGARPK
jgi:hypothetical protein